MNELELAADVCSNEREHQPSVDTIVLENTFRKHRPVSSTAADHSMDPPDPGDLRVARVGPPNVRASRCFQPHRVVFLEKEIVVPLWILA